MVTDLYIVIAIVLIMTVATIMVRKSCAKNKQKEESEIKNSMPAGLQCFDANGNITVDLTDNLTILLGSRSFSNIPKNTTGSFSIDIPTNSHLFAYVVFPTTTESVGYYPLVNITLNGNVITYQTTSLYWSDKNYAFTVYYGIY
jgi:hypothetical protein